MIEAGAQPVAALRIVACAAVLCGREMPGRLAGRDRAVVALRATRVLRRERDASDGTEPAVIHRRQSEAAAGRVAVTAALAGCGLPGIGSVMVAPVESTKLQVCVPSWQSVHNLLVTADDWWSTNPPTKVDVL